MNPRHYATSYGEAHSPVNARPQRELYNTFHGNDANRTAASQQYFTIYDSSFCAREIAVDCSLQTRPSGFSRNSQSQIGTPTGHTAPAVSEYREAYLPRTAG